MTAWCGFFVRCYTVAVRTWNHRQRADMPHKPQTNHATGAGVVQWVV